MQPHDRRREAGGALPVGDGLRQQARSAAAFRRLPAPPPTTTCGRGRRRPATGRRSPSRARGRRRATATGCSTTRSATRWMLRSEQRGYQLGVRSGAEHLEGPHRHAAAGGPDSAATTTSPSTAAAGRSSCSAATTAASTPPRSGNGTPRPVWGSEAAGGAVDPGRALRPRDHLRLPARGDACSADTPTSPVYRRRPRLVGVGRPAALVRDDAVRASSRCRAKPHHDVQLHARHDLSVRRNGARRHRPTARRSSGSTCPTLAAAERRRLHAGLGGELHVGQLRRRRLLRADRGACNGMCRRATSPAKRGPAQRPRRSGRRHLSHATRPATPTHQCKTRLGQTCASFTDCASGNCVDGVCCDSAATPCKACNLAGKRGTCAYMPWARKTVGAPACARGPGRACDGNGTCMNGRRRPASPARRAASARPALHRRRLLQQRCAQTCYQCNRADAVGTVRPIGVGLVDHSAMTPCDAAMQYCNGAGTCAMNKKPNGETCRRRRLRQRLLHRRHLLQRHLHRHLPVVRGAGRARHVRQRPARRGQIGTTSCGTAVSATPPGCVSRAPSRTAPRAPAAATVVELLRRRSLLHQRLRRHLLRLQRSGHEGTCSPSRPAASTPCDEACAAPTTATDHVCTMGQEAQRRDVRRRPRVRVELLRRRHLLRDSSSHRQVPELQEHDGHLRPPTAWICATTAWASGVCGGTCDGQGACRSKPQGTPCRAGRAARADLGLITDGGELRRRRQLRRTRQTCSATGSAATATSTGSHCKTDCTTDPDCAIRRYCLVTSDGGAPDGGADAGAGSQCPPAHACTRNTQCLSGTCQRRRLLQRQLRQVRLVQRAGTGDRASRSRPGPIPRWSA